MEVWILLAAAGSGYLVRCWRNTHKLKRTFVNKPENEILPTSSKHWFGKSEFGKHHSRWESRLTKHIQASHLDRSLLEQQECVTRTLDGRETLLINDTCSLGDSVKLHDSQSSTADCKALFANECWDVPNGFTSCCVRMSQQEDRVRTALVEFDAEMNMKFSAWSLEENDPFSTSGSCRATFMWDPMSQNGALLTSVTSALENMEAQGVSDLQNISSKEALLPGLCNICQDAFIFGAESCPAKTLSNNIVRITLRKGKTLGRFQRGQCSTARRKAFEFHKPLPSLESCLAAQFDENYCGESRGEASLCAYGGEKPGTIGSTAIELSSSAVQLSVAEFGSGQKDVDYKALHGESVSDDSDVYPKVESKTSNESVHGISSVADLLVRGSSSAMLQGLLFNFGVGVGMMHFIISYMPEIRKLVTFFEEIESLLKCIRDELEGSKDHTINCLLERVKGVAMLFENMLIPSDDDAEFGKRFQLKDMAKLEAELQVELERMELQSDEDPGGCFDKGVLQIHFQNAAGLVSGTHPVHKDIMVNSCGASPEELSSCLNEVLEARQAERIGELEAELEYIGSKLLAKDKEIVMETWPDFR